MGWVGEMWRWVSSRVADWTAEDWSSAAEVMTALIAFAAVVFAWSQVREARRTREAQAQPYVVVLLEPSAASGILMDLVVRNYGTTAARDVRLEFDPSPMRTVPPGQGEPQPVWLPEMISILAPGQEWRTFWDSRKARHDSTLPRQHRVSVKYRMSLTRRTKDVTEDILLDWGVHYQSGVVVYGIHHAAKALRGIEGSLSSWHETGAGLRVVVRDGDRKDKRRKKEYARMRREMARERAAAVRPEAEPPFTPNGDDAVTESS
ncbi:MAG TPA: hypothetical protein VFC00_07545 [Micromonosporaceae bacterium]|nr:hypothetical protein [Micromonosporaceae bacterium]